MGKDEAPLAERMRVLEIQMEHIVSDIESEKGTRARANAELLRHMDDLKREMEPRFRQLERHVAMGIGIVVTCQIVLSVVMRLLLK
jgi:hypothetical protein